MKKKKYAGFTLIEMLIVLAIIAVLVLLFIPNLASQKEKVDKDGDKAFVKVVETQAELYELNMGEKPTIEKMKEKDYLTDEQADKAEKLKIQLNKNDQQK